MMCVRTCLYIILNVPSFRGLSVKPFLHFVKLLVKCPYRLHTSDVPLRFYRKSVSRLYYFSLTGYLFLGQQHHRCHQQCPFKPRPVLVGTKLQATRVRFQ